MAQSKPRPTIFPAFLSLIKDNKIGHQKSPGKPKGWSAITGWELTLGECFDQAEVSRLKVSSYGTKTKVQSMIGIYGPLPRINRG